MVACDNCGKLITWELQRGKWYGSCNTKDCPREHYAKQDEIESELAGYFEALVCPEPELVDWIKVALQSSHKNEIEVHTSSVTQLNRRYDMLQTKLDTLYEDRLEGRISVEYYDGKFKDITDERKAVLEALERLTSSNTDYIEKGVEVLELTQRAAEIYQSKGEQERKALLSDIFSNIGLNGQVLVCEYKKEAAAVLDKVEKTKALAATFEQDENGLVKDKDGFLEASRSIWLGR
jgi:site-specific DNA recombinase